MEKNCRWHFMSEGPSDIGPNDSIVDTFKGRPYYSIVREAIQNSLDVQLNKNKPVVVKFSWFTINRNHYPNLFKIDEHILASKKYYSKNRNAEQLFGSMLEYLNGAEGGLKKDSITCLKISESNTIGMAYKKGASDSAFQGFLRSQGNSIKSDSGAGGSFGYGKGAYFALSPIKTVIVSTKTKDGETFMEGCTRLSTHIDVNGEKKSSIGYYDNNCGEPIIVENNIPVIFKRNEPGTDFNIIGLWDREDNKDIMIKTVLNNFWLAIWDKKLIVEIDDIIIDKNNIENIINSYYQDDNENCSSSDIDNWNPKPYFKAVKYANSGNDHFKLFKSNLSTLGEVKLYVYLNKGLPNRTAFFRGLKMIVYKGRRRNIINGYAAVFLCENDMGNKILRDMENPAHNEWNKENYPKEKGEINSVANKVELEINRFVNETLKKLSKSRITESTFVRGIEEYLYSTEELLEKYEGESEGGEVLNNTGGETTSNTVSEETAIQTTEIINQQIKIQLTKKHIQEVKENDNKVDPDLDGNEKGTVGGSNDSGGGDTGGGGNFDAIKSVNNENGKNKKFLSVRLRVAAQKEEDVLYHLLIINSPKDVKDAEIELLVGGDNESADGIALLSSDNGKIKENILTNVKLSAGKNIVKIKFLDDVKHSIKIKVYEF